MNGKIDTEIGSYLREVIAQHVSNDKVCLVYWLLVSSVQTIPICSLY